MFLKILKALVVILFLLVILAGIYVGLAIWGGTDIDYLRSYVNEIVQVEQIDIYYRDHPDWLDCSYCPSPSCRGTGCGEVRKVVITDPTVIDRLVTAVQNPRDYISYWVNCNHTVKMVFHVYGRAEHILLVCDEGLFTNTVINASGIINFEQLSQDYIFNLELTPQSYHDPSPFPTETVNPELLITPYYITETPSP